MTAFLLDGLKRAAFLKKDLKQRLQQLELAHHLKPGLAVLRIGTHGPSGVYVASKLRQCQEVGIHSFLFEFSESVTQAHVIHRIQDLNHDPRVHGILLQLPLPPSLNSAELINAINPLKDVDGLHPLNMGMLAQGCPFIVPCTPRGCLDLLKQYFKTLEGLKVVIVGRSILVGRPLALVLLNENCTVTMAHSKTVDLPDLCASADIVVAAVGQPALIKKHWIKPGAVVIDVGINSQQAAEGRTLLQGDVDFANVKEVAGAITPVPGGVGPMTVISLLQNTVDLSEKRLFDIKSDL